MSGIPKVITFGLHLAGILQLGFSSHLPGREFKLLNEVSQNLPLAECDMIIVSSEPYKGERYNSVVKFDIVIKIMLKLLSNVSGCGDFKK